MISIRNVTKQFGDRVAVDGLSLEIPRGEIYGLLGHNGAGKSTTIGMLLGQILPDAGELLVNGCDVQVDRHRALERVGAIYETPGFYDYLTGEHNLQIFCDYTSLFDQRRLSEVVKFVGLEERIHDRVGDYSHGMRQRLALAQALLPQPELLILDEPSTGLDPQGIHEMRQLILRLNREWGLTILFSSHLLTEVQQLCRDVAVLREGQLLFAGNWRELGIGRQWIRLQVDRQVEAEAGLLAAGLIVVFEAGGLGQLSERTTVAAINEWLVNERFQVQAIHPIEPTLETFYLELHQAGGKP